MVLSMERWVGKVAVVTGASSGIGAGIAEQLVKQGLLVVGFARRQERIDDLAKNLQGEKGKLYSCKVDVTIEEDILRGFKWTSENVGPVSILVNNAGCMTNANLLDGETELWKKVLDTNLLGLCIATREATKIMRENNIDGHVIHINSIGGHRVPNYDKLNVYSGSKFGVTALTETLRQDLNRLKSKIKVTSISPGYVRTELMVASGASISLELLDTYPSVKAEDIADGVIYVLSTPLGVQVHELIIRSTGEL